MSSGEGELVRPDLRVRSHGARIFGLALLTCFAMSVGAVITLRALDEPAERPAVPRETHIHIAPVIVVEPQPAPPRSPLPPSPPPPSPPSAEAEPAEKPVRRVKAAAPRIIDPSCIVTENARRSCSWDDGLPAVSTDGTLVATKVIPDDGGRGYPGLTIRFLDVKTSKIMRDVLVLDPDEIDWNFHDPELDQNAPDAAHRRAQLVKRMTRRAAVAQKLLDEKGYRPLEHLGSASRNPDEVEWETREPAGNGVHAEFDHQAVRAIDPVTSTALWSHRFDVQSPFSPDSDNDCELRFELVWLSVWWDPETRVVLGTSSYQTGGCMCGSLSYEQVVRMP